MPRQGGLRVGVGGAVQTSRTTQPTQPLAPQHPRQHKPNGNARHPPTSPNTRGSASPQGEARRECAGKAERSDCRGREDYGWGWAGGANKPYHATHPTPRPPTPAAAQAERRRPPPTSPNTRGSASPKGEARRECAGKAERSERRAREDYGWGWAGGVTRTGADSDAAPMDSERGATAGPSSGSGSPDREHRHHRGHRSPPPSRS